MHKLTSPETSRHASVPLIFEVSKHWVYFLRVVALLVTTIRKRNYPILMILQHTSVIVHVVHLLLWNTDADSHGWVDGAPQPPLPGQSAAG